MKKKLTVQEEIKQRNEIFRSATQREKRVLIAKDVLAQIKLGRIIPRSGNWVDILERDILKDNDSIQEKVLDNTTQCECCGVGSLLLSCTLFKNRITVEEHKDGQLKYGYIVDGDVKDKTGIREIFEPSQLRLIELAFERGYGLFTPNIKQKDGEDTDDYAYFDRDQRALDFGRNYVTDTNRLKAIMQNIIDNDGTFIP